MNIQKKVVQNEKPANNPCAVRNSIIASKGGIREIRCLDLQEKLLLMTEIAEKMGRAKAARTVAQKAVHECVERGKLDDVVKRSLKVKALREFISQDLAGEVFNDLRQYGKRSLALNVARAYKLEAVKPALEAVVEKQISEGKYSTALNTIEKNFPARAADFGIIAVKREMRLGNIENLSNTGAMFGLKKVAVRELVLEEDSIAKLLIFRGAGAASLLQEHFRISYKKMREASLVACKQMLYQEDHASMDKLRSEYGIGMSELNSDAIAILNGEMRKGAEHARQFIAHFRIPANIVKREAEKIFSEIASSKSAADALDFADNWGMSDEKLKPIAIEAFANYMGDKNSDGADAIARRWSLRDHDILAGLRQIQNPDLSWERKIMAENDWLQSTGSEGRYASINSDIPTPIEAIRNEILSCRPKLQIRIGKIAFRYRIPKDKITECAIQAYIIKLYNKQFADAAFIASKFSLGEDKICEAARMEYGRLITASDPTRAAFIARKYKLKRHM